ncbi:hypothetical protein HYN59_14845 [Flavobacterium album]|uniref:Uncharacterized protein n=1 Tax=Flavobacterium album TaxID=2175091 RepID=A0A2S1R148_9FLAO|nr:hypothetical protein [Flavobacterium album]AWH86306.1 hypothetical protein HYN59_14845 [Flavobacterium album]
MTLIVSWIGVDEKKKQKKIASLYIASDSRYSWGNLGKYDNGVKVFRCINAPEIFGFCGDVLFPSNLVSQLITQIDNGLFFSGSETSDVKSRKIANFISEAVKYYPIVAFNQNFTIIYGTRIADDFHLFKYIHNYKTRAFDYEEINLPLESGKVFSGGSGSEEFDKNYQSYENPKHNEYGTSRGVYQCFVRTLLNIKDKYSGGAPQIVGLYRKGNAVLFGSVITKKLYIYGQEFIQNTNAGNIEWRNENFERTNPETGKILDGAQRQPSKDATP